MYLIIFVSYRRMSLVDDDLEDGNAMQASVWDGEFLSGSRSPNPFI